MARSAKTALRCRKQESLQPQVEPVPLSCGARRGPLQPQSMAADPARRTSPLQLRKWQLGCSLLALDKESGAIRLSRGSCYAYSKETSAFLR
jgi:hypothetical protein